MSDIPLWRLCERLRREAQEHIDGRRRFEQTMNRLSSKPLPGVVVDSVDMIRILDDYERLRRLEVAESVQSDDSLQDSNYHENRWPTNG